MNRVFIDMDGVIVDFERRMRELECTGDELKRMPAAYLTMPEMPGATAAVRSIIGMGYNVFIATKPPTGIAFAYMDKAQWVLNHLPELKRKIIITHDKGLLGDQYDYLIDDRPHKANCGQFKGTLLGFIGDREPHGYTWSGILGYFTRNRPRRFE